MRIFFTGGTGKVGVASVRRLAAAGHSVTVVGRRESADVGPATYERCDIDDFENLRRLMDGHDAVVHYAAIPHPVSSPGRRMFRVNALGTYNVYEAAAECGIRRVVSTSSINAFGYFYGDRSFPLAYLPIDEDHPGMATDAYSFTKQVMERIGEYYWERDRISGTMLRLPAVYPHERVMEGRTHFGREVRESITRLLDHPPEERATRVQEMSEAYDRFRTANRLDRAVDMRSPMKQLGPDSDLKDWQYPVMTRIANFFAYVDDEDAAQAVEKSLIGEYEGCDAIYINARRNDMALPLEQLATLYWPRVPEIRSQADGDDTLVSIDRARELIGYEPEWEMQF